MEDSNQTDESGNALSDELLVVRCQLGEPGAFAELIHRWHEPLWRYVRRMTDDDDTAADVLQDLWLRVLRAMPRLREAKRARAWLFGIARRTVMDRLRRHYRTPETVSVDDVEVSIDDTEGDLEADLIVMRDALARMPFTERDVLVLFYLNELTLEQIVEVLAIPVGTVKSRLFRARRMLRQQLLDMGVQP